MRTAAHNPPGPDATERLRTLHFPGIYGRSHLARVQNVRAWPCLTRENNAVLLPEASRNRDVPRVVDKAMKSHLSALPRTENRGGHCLQERAPLPDYHRR